MGLPEGDIRQLPGVLIIESDGRIIYRYDGNDPADHPSPAVIVEQLKAR
jgi:hypothetical protein